MAQVADKVGIITQHKIFFFVGVQLFPLYHPQIEKSKKNSQFAKVDQISCIQNAAAEFGIDLLNTS